MKWDPLQRLFSTFPDGWPGLGLLVLRLGAAIPLVYFAVSALAAPLAQPAALTASLIAGAGGLLLLVGLWTPVAGIVVAIDELWSVVAIQASPREGAWLQIMLAVLAAGVAMLGPGAWSVDARLFGRKRFEINGQNRR